MLKSNFTPSTTLKQLNQKYQKYLLVTQLAVNYTHQKISWTVPLGGCPIHILTTIYQKTSIITSLKAKPSEVKKSSKKLSCAPCPPNFDGGISGDYMF